MIRTSVTVILLHFYIRKFYATYILNNSDGSGSKILSPRVGTYSNIRVMQLTFT